MSSSVVDEKYGALIRSLGVKLREELIDEIFDCLYGLSNVADEQSQTIEKLTGLSKNQALAIKAVSRSPSVRVSELARSMHLNPATMVRILDRLEEQGLIMRTRSLEDRRVVEIALTDRAKEVEQNLLEITHDRIVDRLESTDDRDLVNMLVALHRLSSLLDHPASGF